MIPTAPSMYETLNTADWRESFVLLVDGQPRTDLGTGAGITGALKMKGQPKVIISDIDVDGHVVTLNVDRLVLLDLPPGVYEFSLTLNGDETLVYGRVKIKTGPEA